MNKKKCKILIFVFCIVVFFVLLHKHIAVNASESFPLGVYLKLDRDARKHDLVLISPPSREIFKEALDKRVLHAGFSRAKTCNLIKLIVATDGDFVRISKDGMIVNGIMLENSSRTQFPFSNSVEIPFEKRLKKGELVVYSPHPRSFDSRYFGILSENDIVKPLKPLMTLPWRITK